MKDREELLLRVIHLMAEKFKDRIVLEGGMLLRLLGCPRSTQDVDYVLLSLESKKTLAEKTKKVLIGLEGVQVADVALNSRGIFIRVETTGKPTFTAMVEIGVAASLNLAADHLSTVSLANKHLLGGRVVTTMALPEAFANKIASALERNTLRDLYDVSILEPLCTFDATTLAQRLQNLSVERKKPKSVRFGEAATMLKAKAKKITPETVKAELAPLLPPHQTEGIEKIIQAAVIRVAEKLAHL